jgi:hypothetical protein
VVYRIRYSDTGGHRQQEVLVEAHNTTEAMVKFCHARGPAPGAGLASGRVSISAEPEEGSLVESDPIAFGGPSSLIAADRSYGPPHSPSRA